MTNRTEANRMRRNLLAMGAATIAGLYGPALRANGDVSHFSGKSHELVNVHDFKSDAGPDWTAAVNAATAVAGRVYFPAGEYMLNAANWPSNTEIFGDGDATVLHVQVAADYLFSCDSGSPRIANNTSNLYMHDLQVRGTCDVDGFSEHKHLLNLNGVSNVRFRNVLFKGFRGDGLYIGSGNQPGMERHNTNVSVENCRFDGINNANRNAITIIDCDGMQIANCTFENTTAPHMPGAIDAEPNKFSFHVVKNLRIVNNRFRKIGGFTGIIAVSVPSEVGMTPSNILIEGNTSTDYLGKGGFFFFNANRLPAADSTDNNILVQKNRMRGGGKAFLLTGKRITVRDNVFEDLKQSGNIGYVKDVDLAFDIDLINNVFLRCGSAEGYGVAVHKADHVRFIGNSFIDCGTGTPPRASAVVFRRGRSSNVTFERNKFSSPAGMMRAAITRDAAHSMQPPTNRFSGNEVNGLVVQFQSGDDNST